VAVFTELTSRSKLNRGLKDSSGDSMKSLSLEKFNSATPMQSESGVDNSMRAAISGRKCWHREVAKASNLTLSLPLYMYIYIYLQ